LTIDHVTPTLLEHSHTTLAWRQVLNDLLYNDGVAITSPDSLGGAWRGKTTRELVGYPSVWSMASPVVLCPGRFPEGRGHRFMMAEAAWILSGDNRLSTIFPFAKALAGLSDDGRTMGGAYGPPFVDQVSYVQRAIEGDLASRQAVITIWRPRPQLGGKDVPCTVALQWLVRSDLEGQATLHCVATMRSSDAWMGLPFDVFTFSAMSAFIALALRPKVGDLALGLLTLTAGSQHLYQVDWGRAAECEKRESDDLLTSRPIEPINLHDFTGPDDLVEHLWSCARRSGVYHGPWLRELEKI
jgi:hypothetical protein